MNKNQALAILKDYVDGKSNPADYAEALEYIRGVVETGVDLAPLYQAVTRPGGISCETAQTLMLQYVDIFSDANLSDQQRKQLTQHLTQCPNCSEEFLAIGDVETVPTVQTKKIPQFKIPPISLKKNWPALGPFGLIKRIDSATKLVVSILLKPNENLQTNVAFRGDNNILNEDEQIILVATIIGELKIGVKVVATRTNDDSCKLLVTLDGEEIVGKKAGQRITCRFEQTTREAKTNQKGQAVFEAVPIEALDKLQIEVEIAVQ